MLVTINTDASFHPILKHGAYAFWIICDDFKISKSGVFRDKCINPDDAEAKCMINALKSLLSTNNNTNVITKIIINTDSLNGIALIKNDKEHIKRYIGKNIKRWKHIRIAYHNVLKFNKNKFVIEFRHVKAHTNINDKRSYVNNWCDSEAKKELRRLI